MAETRNPRPEDWLRTIAARAHCILWHAEVTEREDGSLAWKLRVVDEEAARRFFPVFIPPGMSYDDAWYASRLPEDVARMEYGDRQVRAGASYTQEFRCRRIDGEVRWFSEDVQVEAVAPGRWHAVGVCVDITERKEAELALRASREEEYRFAQRLTALHEVSNRLSKAASFDDLCREAVELGRSHLGFDRLGIWFLEEGGPLPPPSPERGGSRGTPHGTVASARGSFGVDEQGNLRDERQSRVTITKPSMAGQVLEGRKRVLHWRETQVRDNYARIVGRGEQAIAGLWDGEEVIGFISTDNYLRREPITDRQVELLSLFAAVLGHLGSRKRAEEALQASERRFRALIEGGWDAVALLDARGMLFYASPSVTRILGWAPEEMNGSCFLDRLHPEDAPRCSALFAQIVEWPGTSISTACRYQTKRGDWVWIEGTGTNLLQEPGVEGVVLNFRDVTERRRMEEELHARAEALAEADRAKDRFLAMLAHELRNPLAPILSAVELLKRSGSTEPHVTLAQEVIERQASHQARLLEDLLHVSRIARGQISLHSIRLDLVQLVHDTVEDHRRPLEGAGLELRSELPGEPVWVEGDPTRLAQVLGNLLQNAAKFTDPGGRVVVTVKTEEPATAGVPSGMAGSLPAPGRAGGEVAVTVRDTGIGIDAEMLERIFETFTQADGSLERSRGGLGLGLALVRGLVALHGGRVRAESAGPGQGAVFTFWLPVCDAPAAQLSAPGSRLPARTVPAGSREPERSDHSSAPDSRGRG